METLGALSILLAFCLAIYAVVGSVVGAVKHRPYLTKSAERRLWGASADGTVLVPRFGE